MLKNTIKITDNSRFELIPNNNGYITEIKFYEEEQFPLSYKGKQAKVLLLLLNNYPHIISREDIYKAVWLDDENKLKEFQQNSIDEQNKILNTKVKNTISKIIPFNESVMHDCLRSYGTAYSIVLLESPFIDENNSDNDNNHDINIENNIKIEKNVNVNVVNIYAPNIQWKEAWKLKKEGDQCFSELVKQMNLLSSSSEKKLLFDSKKATEFLSKSIDAYEEFLSYSLLQNSNSNEIGIVYRNLASCYFYSKEYEKGIDYLTISAKRYWNVTAMQNLAFMQKKRGNFTEAEKWYKIASALGCKAAEFQLNQWMKERKNNQNQ